MIIPGQRLKADFTLKVVQDRALKEVVFSSLLNRHTIVSVYMKNDTGSCDRQNDALAEVWSEVDRAGLNLVALSRDTAGSHLRYATKRGVRYILASDPKDQFATAADAIVEKQMYGRKFFGPARSAYLLAPDGTVESVIEKVDTADHAAQLRTLLATRR